MHLVLVILLQISLYLPMIVQGPYTHTSGLIENTCGPINDAYVELVFHPSEVVIVTDTDESGKFFVRGPEAQSVTAITYNGSRTVTVVDGKAYIYILYNWCGQP